MRAEITAVSGKPIKWEAVASDNSKELSVIIIEDQEVLGRIVFTERGSVVVDYPASLFLTEPRFTLKKPVDLLDALCEWKKMDNTRAERKERIYRICDDIQWLIDKEK